MKTKLIPVAIALVIFGAYKMTGKKLSEKGLNLIKIGEGLSLEPYRDSAGHLTIGYGHKIRPNETFTRISKAQAEGILRQDASFAEKAVNELVKTPLNQDEFDALTSFVFNVGRTNFANSTLLSALNHLDQQAPNLHEAKTAILTHELQKWNKITDPITGKKILSDGLVRRRTLEITIAQGNIPPEMASQV